MTSKFSKLIGWKKKCKLNRWELKLPFQNVPFDQNASFGELSYPEIFNVQFIIGSYEPIANTNFIVLLFCESKLRYSSYWSEPLKDIYQ